MVSVKQRNDLALSGCTPEPLMAYLKALGVFRLVSEQNDPGVRACWRHDTFVLRTTLDRDGLVRFFLEEYRPTPIVAPWNKGSGFFKAKKGISMKNALEAGDNRFTAYQTTISIAANVLKDLQITAPQQLDKEPVKRDVLGLCRARFPDEAVQWLDAVHVMTSTKAIYMPLLGSGGNDGNLEFSLNFVENLVSALGIQAGSSRGRKTGSSPVGGSRDLLVAALFGEASPSLIKDRTAGQFSPGSVGGPNATAGFEADSLTNPWDYVLMIEGTLFFAGAVARRLSPESRARAIFPFTVDTSAAGYGTAADNEYGKASRSEVWMPLWDQPATCAEVAHVFAEGRAQLGSRQAATGTDFARAIAGLGVERGISEFVRFGLLKRSGRAYLATYLGRFRVKANPRVDVLFDIDGWLGGLRRADRGKDTPGALARHLRNIDGAILELCQALTPQSGYEHARPLQRVLAALGQVETWLARARVRDRIPPLSGLRPREWLDQANDGSPEFRIAAAIASIQGVASIGPIRANLEPVEVTGARVAWAKDNPSMVWQGSDLLQDMAAVLHRRCLEARMKATEGEAIPLRGAVGATLGDILAFLEGRLDERRIAHLVLPLATLDWRSLPQGYKLTEAGTDDKSRLVGMPLPYAALRLLFLPWKLRRSPGAPEVGVKPESSVLSLLGAGRVDEAYRVAWRRLYISGLTPLAREADVPACLARRLAAALVIPISYQDMFTLADMALMPASEGR